MAASSDLLKISKDDQGILKVEFDRKDKMNAFSEELLRQVAHVLTDAREDDSIKVVVVTGGDTVFAAGGDLKEWESKTPIELWSSKRNEYWGVINGFPKPIVAAVNGYAYGGGCEFALASDIVVCGSNAKFALPEISLGFVPGRGGTQRLPSVVGKSAASYMILTGRPVGAKQAVDIGLALEECDPSETVARATEIALNIAVHPTEAVQIGKELIKNTYPHIPFGLQFEARSFEFLKGTDASKALTKRFLEKREKKGGSK